MTAPLPSALAPRDKHRGIPERQPGEEGLPPNRLSAHTQVRRLSHSSTRSADSTLNIFPCWGLAAPPHLARHRCRSDWGRVEGSRQPIWPLAHLVLRLRPPAVFRAGTRSRTVTPCAPPSPFTRDARLPRAPPATPAAPRPRPQPWPELRPTGHCAKSRSSRPASPPRAPRRPPLRVSARARRGLAAAAAPPRAPSRKRGSALAPVPALQSRKETASGCLGGVAGVVPGNNLYPQTPVIGEVSSAVERYAPPSHPSGPWGRDRPRPPGSGPTELRVGLAGGGTTPGLPPGC